MLSPEHEPGRLDLVYELKSLLLQNWPACSSLPCLRGFPDRALLTRSRLPARFLRQRRLLCRLQTIENSQVDGYTLISNLVLYNIPADLAPSFA